MPLPWLMPLVNVAAGLIQSGLGARTARYNTDATIGANRQMADYAYSKDIEMMNAQNEYNRSMWDLNNQYNSPGAQMARFKEAGLNPNLVYGHGATATSQGPPPRSEMAKYQAPTAQYNYRPSVDLPEMISRYQDFSVRQAQIDNLKAQTENTNARTLNESLQGSLLGVRTRTGEFDLEQRSKLAPYQLELAQGSTTRMGMDIREQLQRIANMEKDEQLKVLERMQREKQLGQMDLLKDKLAADVLFSQYRNQWMKEGITSSDNPLLRIIVRMLGAAGLSPNELFSK